MLSTVMIDLPRGQDTAFSHRDLTQDLGVELAEEKHALRGFGEGEGARAVERDRSAIRRNWPSGRKFWRSAIRSVSTAR